MVQSLTDDMIETIQLAARKLTGFQRRDLMAAMTLKYCGGSARKAETAFGWGRAAVNTGLHERRTGIRCLDNFRARGRQKSEVQTPQLTEEIKRVVEPHAQADPKFQTTLAFTRITARAVRNELLKSEELSPVVPCRQTVGEILHRLGYRLRRVLKVRPEKNSRDKRHLRQRPGASVSGRDRQLDTEDFLGYQGQSEDWTLFSRRTVAGSSGSEGGRS